MIPVRHPFAPDRCKQSDLGRFGRRRICRPIPGCRWSWLSFLNQLKSQSRKMPEICVSLSSQCHSSNRLVVHNQDPLEFSASTADSSPDLMAIGCLGQRSSDHRWTQIHTDAEGGPWICVNLWLFSEQSTASERTQLIPQIVCVIRRKPESKTAGTAVIVVAARSIDLSRSPYDDPSVLNQSRTAGNIIIIPPK